MTFSMSYFQKDPIQKVPNSGIFRDFQNFQRQIKVARIRENRTDPDPFSKNFYGSGSGSETDPTNFKKLSWELIKSKYFQGQILQ